MRSGLKLVILMAVLLASIAQAASGFTIKLEDKIKLSQETALIQRPLAFCATEDELFLVTDYKASNVKVYDAKGKLVAVIGRKGVGPQEFLGPFWCSYDQSTIQFGVLDLGVKKIFIYQREGATGFKRIEEILCLTLGYDLQLKGNKLFVSGYKIGRDNKPFDLYYIDLPTGQATFLLPSYYKYGLESYQQYEAKYLRKPDFKAMGGIGFFDVYNDNAYFVWESDLKIIKINIKSRKLSFFGKKTAQYVKPHATKKLLEGYRARDKKIIQTERAGMSFIRDIFAGPKYVIVIYEGPAEKDNPSNFRLQLYTLRGEFLQEISIPDKPSYRLYLDKNRNILYSLSSELDADLNEHFFMLKFKISE